MSTINSKLVSAEVSRKGRSLFAGFFWFGIVFPCAIFALAHMGGAS